MEETSSILMKRYEMGRFLGQGTFAKVYHGRDIETGMNVAIKVIGKEKVLKGGMAEQIKREISVMRLVKHPNVVQLYEVMASKTKVYFVMEYVKGGELFNKVLKGKLQEELARKYFQQLISAVDFCHSRGVYHRDLKPENLLLDEHGNLKVSDFGLSTLSECKHQDGLLHTTCGTPSYVAPEVINRKGYDGAKADIWSCGVILYVLLAGFLPFNEVNLMEMYKKIAKAEFKYPNWFAPDVRRLISKILNPNSKTRIPIEKIMIQSWFRRGLNPKPEVTQTGSEEQQNDVNNCQGKPVNLNAFDIISLSAGFDLSGLFEDSEKKKKEGRFTSKQTAMTIISKLEELAKKLKMKVTKKEGGKMKLEGVKAGRKGVVSFDAEIYEVTHDFHMVEVTKSNGDTLEFHDLMKRDIRPGLKDIVWCWQGDDVSVSESPIPQVLPVPAPLQAAQTEVSCS